MTRFRLTNTINTDGRIIGIVVFAVPIVILAITPPTIRQWRLYPHPHSCRDTMGRSEAATRVNSLDITSAERMLQKLHSQVEKVRQHRHCRR